jgi:hypothetical protein
MVPFHSQVFVFLVSHHKSFGKMFFQARKLDETAKQ